MPPRTSSILSASSLRFGLVRPLRAISSSAYLAKQTSLASASDIRITVVPRRGVISTSRSACNSRIAARMVVRLTPNSSDNATSSNGAPAGISLFRMRARNISCTDSGRDRCRSTLLPFVRPVCDVCATWSFSLVDAAACGSGLPLVSQREVHPGTVAVRALESVDRLLNERALPEVTLVGAAAVQDLGGEILEQAGVEKIWPRLA